VCIRCLSTSAGILNFFIFNAGGGNWFWWGEVVTVRWLAECYECCSLIVFFIGGFVDVSFAHDLDSVC
jgi:hypothetical protein